MFNPKINSYSAAFHPKQTVSGVAAVCAASFSSSDIQVCPVCSGSLQAESGARSPQKDL